MRHSCQEKRLEEREDNRKASIPGTRRLRLVLLLFAGGLVLAGCRVPTPRTTAAIMPPPRLIPWEEMGRSLEGRTIRAATFGYGRNATLIFGGFHGDEPVSAELAIRLAEYLNADRSHESGSLVVIVPEVNADGLHHHTRKNARGVDLNRNLPASNWRKSKSGSATYGGPYPESEPETTIVLRLLRTYQPRKVITIHQSRRGRMVDYNGPAGELAKEMSRQNHYPADMFYGNKPGSLGSYVGMDKQIPIITLELPRGISPSEAWRENREALLAAIRF